MQGRDTLLESAKTFYLKGGRARKARLLIEYRQVIECMLTSWFGKKGWIEGVKGQPVRFGLRGGVKTVRCKFGELVLEKVVKHKGCSTTYKLTMEVEYEINTLNISKRLGRAISYFRDMAIILEDIERYKGWQREFEAILRHWEEDFAAHYKIRAHG